jgi:hypothetical protein
MRRLPTIKPLFLILLYFLINLIQISFTELTSDEAYYWLYTKQLEWGYYDHPPMVSLLTAMGSSIWPTEFGVRIFHLLSICLSLFLLFKLIPKKAHFHAGLILFSLPLFHYVSFIVFPDSGLVAFTIGFLYFYKRFLDKQDLLSVIGLGLTLALTLYAKYHAVLLPFFLLLSNLRLVRNPKAYLAVFIAIVLYLPHLYWQYTHDFVSFQYHLIGRSSAFQPKFLLEFLAIQSLILGLGLIFVPFVFKAKDKFQSGLKFVALGSIIFFALSSMRGYVHLHWTSIATPALIIIGAHFYARRRTNRLLWGMLAPFLLLLLVLRTYLIVDIFGSNHWNVDYYHGRPLWAADILQAAGGDPVVFETGNNGLREAPMYEFYSDSPSLALFPGDRKKSQYQIWNYEDRVQNRSVLLLESNDRNGAQAIETRMGKRMYGEKIDVFRSYTNIKMELNDLEISGDEWVITSALYNHRDIRLEFDEQTDFYVEVRNGDILLKREIEAVDSTLIVESGSRHLIKFNPIKRDNLEEDIILVFGIQDRIRSINGIEKLKLDSGQ